MLANAEFQEPPLVPGEVYTLPEYVPRYTYPVNAGLTAMQPGFTFPGSVCCRVSTIGVQLDPPSVVRKVEKTPGKYQAELAVHAM
jgi:hypothetical protein